jgi:hypothetical protein
MKHLQPKTLMIMLAVLSVPNRRFSQKGIWQLCNRHQKVSVGQVNKVVRYLERVGYVERMWDPFEPQIEMQDAETTIDIKMQNGRYHLNNPLGLLNYISLSRDMRELRLFTFEVSDSEKGMITELSKRDVVFCLGTALERYSAYFRPEEISFYTTEPKTMFELLRTAEQGKTKVVAYRPDFLGLKPIEANTGKDPSTIDPLLFNTSEQMNLTSRPLTIMDMFCDQKGAYARTLVKQMWGIEI